MSYRLRYSDEAGRALREAAGRYRQRFRRTIQELADDPRPPHAAPMREPDFYKIRFDRWRLVYMVRDETGELFILRVIEKTGPEAYLGLERPAQE